MKTVEPKLIFKGTVEKIEAEIDKPSSLAEDRIYIKLKLNLENVGSVPVIFLQSEPEIEKATIAEKEENDEVGSVLAETDGRGSSYGMKETEWKNIQEKLDKPTPPPGNTHIIFPGTAINFETVVRIDLPQQPEKHTFSLKVNRSLSSLKELSPIWLILKGETWTMLPLVINNSVNKSEKQKFGQKLKKQWKDVGYLWLEDITSEPIEVNFSSVTYKTSID